MISQNSFKDIAEFENSLTAPTKQTNKREPNTYNITSNEEDYTSNNKNNNLDFKDIDTIDTDLKNTYETKQKISNSDLIDSKFVSDKTEYKTDNTSSSSKSKNKSKIPTDDDTSNLKNTINLAKSVATANPLGAYKAIKKIHGKKKSKIRKILIWSTCIIPLFTITTVGAIGIYIIVFNTSDILTPQQIIQLRYAKLMRNSTDVEDIVQKVISDKTFDETLPTTDDTTTDNSDKYLTVTTSKVPYYSQHDPRWKDKEYSPGETYSQSACGATSLAMVLTYLKNTELDTDGDGVILPTETGEYSLKNGYVTEQGTLPGLFLKLPGLKSEYLTPGNDMDRIKELLSKGEPLIYSVNGSTTFASSHLMVATGYKDDKWTVNDPNNYEFSNKEWDTNKFLSGAYYFVYIHK